MPSRQPSLLARDDTMFGVCAGIGEDFGFNPNYLRVALGVLLLFNPPAVLGAYAAGAAVVLLSRWVFPNPVQWVDEADGDVRVPQTADAQPRQSDREAEGLAIAA